MLAEIVAPPVLEAGAATIVALGGVAAFIVGWGLSHGWGLTFGPVLRWLGNLGLSFSVHGFGVSIHPFGFALTLNTRAQQAFNGMMGLGERAMVYGIGVVLWTFVDISFTLVKLAYDTYNAVSRLGHSSRVTVTKVVRETVVKPVERAAHYTDAKLTARVNGLTTTVASLAARVAHIATATAGAVASPFPRIGRVERDLSGLRKRVGSLEKQIAAGVGVALLVRALAKAGLSWLRCRNVSKAGKAVCKMDDRALEALLLNAALLGVAFNLEDFAKEMQAVTADAARLIHSWAT